MSLGYISAQRNPPIHPRSAGPRLEPELPRAANDAPPAPVAPVRPAATASLRLAALNIALALLHATGAGVASRVTFNYALTFFSTRYTNEAIANFTCIYNYGNEASGARYCSDAEFSYDPRCDEALAAYNRTGTSPFTSPSGGPSLLAYELTHFTLGDAEDPYPRGVAAARWILVTIEVVTAAFHLLYAAIFLRIYFDAPRTATVLKWLIERGGVPARWVEYSITASLMSFFLANTANVWELYALLSLSLGTYALMYFGMQIEQLLAAGKAESALLLAYVPCSALFAAAWIPPLRQIGTDILKLSCSDWSEPSVFECKEKTCFGEENPIALYVFVLFAFFCTFPLVLLFKIYYAGGYCDRWSRAPIALLRQICLVTFTKGASYPLFAASMGVAHAGLFLAFAALGGWAVALYRLFLIVFWPAFPYVDVSEQTPTTRLAGGFFLGEALFALASAITKLYLLITFLVLFAARTNW